MEVTFQISYITPIWYILLLILKPNKNLVLLIPFLILLAVMGLLYFGKLSKANEAAEILFFVSLFSFIYLLKHDPK